MRLSGIKLKHKKGTQFFKTISLEVPKEVILPLSQHMGAPCESLVKVGDSVKVGQKIGDSSAFMSTPLHSSVSGKVTAINDFLLSNGTVCKAIVIETDGLQTISEEVCPPEVNDKASLVKAIKESGCCGLGGAGFPTHVKLNYDETKTPIDTLIINAAECEPYITSDYRELIESTEDVIEGIQLLMKYLDIKHAIICIEDNKPQAIKKLQGLLNEVAEIDIAILKSSYPQGAEKVVIFSATGRIVQEGQLPSNQGVIVMNVSTIGFINRYLKTGMPLIEKRVTVEGDIIENPINVSVLIGTPASYILEHQGLNFEKLGKLISGGPMMGTCMMDTDAPIVKTNNALLAIEKGYDADRIQTACIRCGSCMNACPMKLMPMELEKAYDTRNVNALKEHKLVLCMNCGSCTFVCPAKRNLAEKNQLAKALLPR